MLYFVDLMLCCDLILRCRWALEDQQDWHLDEEQSKWLPRRVVHNPKIRCHLVTGYAFVGWSEAFGDPFENVQTANLPFLCCAI